MCCRMFESNRLGWDLLCWLQEIVEFILSSGDFEGYGQAPTKIPLLVSCALHCGLQLHGQKPCEKRGDATPSPKQAAKYHDRCV